MIPKKISFFNVFIAHSYCTPSDFILDLWKIMKCVFFRFRVSLFALIQMSHFSSSSFNSWQTFPYDWPSINTLVSSANIIVNNSSESLEKSLA